MPRHDLKKHIKEAIYIGDITMPRYDLKKRIEEAQEKRRMQFYYEILTPEEIEENKENLKKAKNGHFDKIRKDCWSSNSIYRDQDEYGNTIFMYLIFYEKYEDIVNFTYNGFSILSLPMFFEEVILKENKDGSNAINIACYVGNYKIINFMNSWFNPEQYKTWGRLEYSPENYEAYYKVYRAWFKENNSGNSGIKFLIEHMKNNCKKHVDNI